MPSFIKFAKLSAKTVVIAGIWVVIGLYAAVVLMLQIPAVQEALADEVETVLGEKLDTRVEVGRVDIGMLNRLIIDRVVIYDKSGQKMLRARRLALRLGLPDYAGHIDISSVQLLGLKLDLYRRTPHSPDNFQFVLDAFASKDTTRTKKPDISIRSLIIQRGAIAYHRRYLPVHTGRFDPAHLDIRDIGAYISIDHLSSDSLDCQIRRLTFKEHCGLSLDRLTADITASRRHAAVRQLAISMPSTDIGLEALEADYKFRGDTLSRGTLHYSLRLLPSSIALADIAPLLPSEMPTEGHVRLEARAKGDYQRLDIERFQLAWNGTWLTLHASGNVSRYDWQAQTAKLAIDPRGLEAIARLYPAAAPMVNAGHINIEAAAHGRDKAISGKADILTTAGKAHIEAATPDCKQIEAKAELNDIDLAKLLPSSKAGRLTAKADADINISEGRLRQFRAKAEVESLELNATAYHALHIEAHGAPEDIAAKIETDDPNLALNADAALHHTGRSWHLSAKANLRHIRTKPLGLNGLLVDATGALNLAADLHYDGASHLDGYATLSDVRFAGSDREASLDKLTLRSGGYDGGRFLLLDGDFGRAQITGRFDIRTLLASATGLIAAPLPSLRIAQRRADNNFSLAAHITDTHLLEEFAGVPLRLNAPLTLRAHINDASRQAAAELYAPSLTYAGADYTGAFASLSTPGDSVCLGLTLAKTLAEGRKMDIAANVAAGGDRLHASLNWDANTKHPHSGELNVSAMTYMGAYDFDVLSSKMTINRQQWHISPAHISLSKGRIAVDHFEASHADQHLRISGIASKDDADSLHVDLSRLDVAYILDLVNFHSVDFSGQASGHLTVKAPLGGLDAAGRITVENFRFEDGRMGTLGADVAYDGQKKRIEIDAVADDGPEAQTLINGYVATSPGYIDLDIAAKGTSIEFMQSFTRSFASGVAGKANGKVKLAGPLSNINLTGRLAVDGQVHIDAIGCDYTLQADTVTFVPDDIRMTQVTIRDPKGHTGRLTGGIHHKHLTRLSYDLGVTANNLLAYHFTDFGSELFYGTVYGTGQVNISGRPGRVDMNINVRPERGSTITYDATRTDDITSLDFIRWHDNTARQQSSTTGTTVANDDDRTDIRLSFVVPMNNNANVRVLMDKTTGDYITLWGNGIIRASYYNKGAFTMFGTYAIDGGTYGLTIQNIIKKNFTFASGGRITFQGNPYNATLDLQAIHTVSGVSLFDLGLTAGGGGSTTRANCLMNITGTPARPVIDFDLDMPTLSADERQMVRGLINSQDEMSQQVLYLLAVGRFYPAQNNNQTAQDQRQYSQTSIAMQGLLSGTISSQINNLLQGAMRNDNWTFGANINTGDEGWNNAQYEGLLSGRLLNNRLLIDGQLGYRDNTKTATSTFIGDFDIRYLLTPNGNIAANIYNKANDRYFTKSGLNTQGIGLILKKDFSNFRDLLGIKRKQKKNVKKKK